VALIAYRPLSNGRIGTISGALGQTLREIATTTRKTIAQVALGWLLSRDRRVIAIPGATSLAHLRENCDPLALTDEQLAALDRASR
jgi:diketogulonate reductase-like aldo/keto reductase